jgi:hypothetical protein
MRYICFCRVCVPKGIQRLLVGRMGGLFPTYRSWEQIRAVPRVLSIVVKVTGITCGEREDEENMKQIKPMGSHKWVSAYLQNDYVSSRSRHSVVT